MREELSIYLFQRLLDAEKLPPSSQLREYRLVLESIFGELTRSEARYFDSLYARMQFVFDKLQVSAEWSMSLKEVRKRLSTEEADPDDLAIIKKELSLAIAHFSGITVPDALVALIEDLPSLPLIPSAPALGLIDLRLCVQSISPLEARNNTIYFHVYGKDELLGDVQLDLWDQEHIKYSYLHAILRPFHTLRVIGATSTSGTLKFQGGLVVLEPDILLDISDLAECFDSKGDTPLLFITKKLVPQETSLPMFSGTMVNAMFDAAVRSEDPDLIQTYRSAAGEQAFQSAVFGKQELVKIYTDIRDHHWHNLKTQANQLRARQVRIEPSFMSDTYGLQGRLDCMVEDEQDANVKDILELKGGSPPILGSRVAHKMQVTGYNLLLRSAFGKERKGSSVIFYSKANENPLRDVLNDRISEHRLLSLRNQVIHYILRLAEQDESVFDLINEDVARTLVSFQAVQFSKFYSTWQHANEQVKAYYKKYIGFLCREYLSARTGAYSSLDRDDAHDGFAALWRRSESEKKLNYSILTNLEIISISDNGSRIELKRESSEHSFRQGDMVLLYPKSGAALDPMRHQFIKARIELLEMDKVVITLNHGQINRNYFGSFKTWVIEPDIYDKSYWSNAADLFLLLTADTHKQDLLMGNVAPEMMDKVFALDTTQRIIEQAYEAKDYFLIQGPPGTGKTSKVLTEIVSKLVSAEESVVVVAFTNRAVEEIALQLEKRGLPFLKLGSRGSGAEKKLKAFCEQGDIHLARDHVKQHQIFLATVASMSSKIDQLLKLKENLNTLIVDEASQLTEPQICGMTCMFKKFILIGDQNQLPPVVTQDNVYTSVDEPILANIGLTNLGASLFERLINQAQQKNWHHAYGMLEKHYRMHEDIAGLVNPWYGYKLITGSEVQRIALNQKDELLSPDWSSLLYSSRKIFIPSAYDPTLKMNRDEADKVVSILQWIKKSIGAAFDPVEDVGVITPWRTQIACIREKLSGDEQLRNVQVDTIERYQGSEKKIIIVSMAVSHTRQLSMIESTTQFTYQEGGALKTVPVERKLLVTLSRAKEKIIILGYKPALMKQPVYADVLSSFQQVEIPGS